MSVSCSSPIVFNRSHPSGRGRRVKAPVPLKTWRLSDRDSYNFAALLIIERQFTYVPWRTGAPPAPATAGLHTFVAAHLGDPANAVLVP